MKKLLLSLFFVLNITFGCFGAEEEKVDGTVYTLVSQEYCTETDEMKRENGFRVTQAQLQTLSLGLPLTMTKEAEEDDNNTIDLPQVRGGILRFILSLEQYVNDDGTLNRDGINIQIEVLLSRTEVQNRLELISECIIALSYLDSPAILEVFNEQFTANIHTFDGSIEDNLNAISLLQQTCDRRIINRTKAELLPYFLELKNTYANNIVGGEFGWNPQKTQYFNTTHDNRILIYNTETAQLLRALVGHTDRPNHMAWSPNGQQLVSTSDDGTIKVWNTESGENTETIHLETGLQTGVSWSPSGTKIAISSNITEIKDIRIWDITTQQITILICDNSRINHFKWNKDGSKIISGSENGTIRIWDTNTTECLMALTNGIRSVEFFELNPQETRLAVNKRLNDREVEIWDITTGVLSRTIEAHNGTTYAASWNPAGTTLATCSEDRTIKIWNTRTGELLTTLRTEAQRFNYISWNPKYNLLISNSFQQRVSMWHPDNTNSLIGLRSEAEVSFYEWDKSGAQFYTIDGDSTLRKWGIPELTFEQQLVVLKIIQNHGPLTPETVERIREIYSTLPATVRNNQRFRTIVAEKAFALLPLGERILRFVRRPAFWVPVTIAGSVLAATIVRYWQQGQ
jgi:WD40 repeat protein